MAPELLRGGERDERSDQYAFCVSLWRCLDRHYPYSGRNTEELLADIEVGEPKIAELDARMPGGVRDVLRIGLREEPGQRFANMRALLDALARARGPRVIEGAVLEPSVGAETPPRPPPSLTVLKGLLIGFALASIISGMLALAGDEPEQVTSETLVDPVTRARQDFQRAERALDQGHHRAGYEAWNGAYSDLTAEFPEEAGRRTLELATKMAKARPGQATSAWMAASAAEAYEQAALANVGHAEKRQRWKNAAKAREQAATFHRSAKDEDGAGQQDRCRRLNEAGQPCEPPGTEL